MAAGSVVPGRRLRDVSSVTESRGIQYSAETAGEPGNVRCHVIRRPFVHERRARYSIFVSNGSDADTRAVAFAAAGDGSRRAIVQALVGAGSDFSTSVMLELTPDGLMPELCIVLTGDGAQFTLVVPSLLTDFARADRSPSASSPALEPAGSSVPARLRPAFPVRGDVYAPPAQPYIAAVPNGIAAAQRIGRVPSRSRSSPPVTPVVLLFAALLAVAGAFVARPQLSVVVPATAAPDAAITVSYRATGIGAAAYALLGPDGQTIARGPLALGEGSFALPLPRSATPQSYLVRLRVENPLGSAGADSYVRVPSAPAAPQPAPTARPKQAAPPLAAPQIRSLALDRAALVSGDKLTVYYDVSATGGTIALLDPASQITYGKSELAASGNSTFVAPHVDATRLLMVVVTAKRGGSIAESRIGVTVAPADAPQPPGDASRQPGDASLTGPATSTVIDAPTTVRSGQPIRIDIRGAESGVGLALMDGTGRELARRDVPAGQRSVVFTAPAVRAAARLMLEATYAQGVGNETVVRVIEVMP